MKPDRRSTGVTVVYSPGGSDLTEPASPLRRNLHIAVAVLGLASYCVSFGLVTDSGDLGWPVRFAVLATLAAVLGLLPRQKPHPLLTAALAAMGFLDGLSSVVTHPAGWALAVIVALNGLQAVAAIAAAVLAPKPEAATATSGYEAYVDYYNQAVQHYYQQQASATPPVSSQHSGYGQAYGQAQYAAQAPATAQAAQPSAPQYGEYTDLIAAQQEYGQTATGVQAAPDAAAPPPARAGAGPTQAPAGHATQHAEESADPTWPQ